MSFSGEFSEMLKQASAPYSCKIIAGLGGYFEGVATISELDTDKIVLAVKKGQIVVEGKKLNVEKYYGGDVMLSGIITRVTFDELR